jgi:hypothetical protein
VKAAWLGVCLIALAAASGCSDKKVTAPPPPSTGTGQPPAPFVHPPPGIPSLTLGQLLSAPDSLRLDSTSTTIPVSVDLYRDFQPFGSPPDGRPMVAIVLFSPPFSDSTDVYLWAIRDSSDVWVTTMDFQWIEPRGDHDVWNYYAGGGPKWDPDTYVDVVIGVRTSFSDVRLVLLRHVQITATG